MSTQNYSFLVRMLTDDFHHSELLLSNIEISGRNLQILYKCIFSVKKKLCTNDS